MAADNYLKPEHVRCAVEKAGDAKAEELLSYVGSSGRRPEGYCAWQEHENTRGLSAKIYHQLEDRGLTPEDAELFPRFPVAFSTSQMHDLRLGLRAESDLERLSYEKADPKIVHELHRLAGNTRADARDYRPIADAYEEMKLHGLSIEELADWIEALGSEERLTGVIEQAVAWREQGFTTKEARLWRAVPPAADRVDTVLDLALEARKHGVALRTAAAWAKAGVRPAEIDGWRQAGVKKASEARALCKHGLGPESFAELAPYLDAGCDLSEAAGWYAAGIPAEDAAHWREAGIDDGRVAAVWAQAGVSPEQAAAYESYREARRAA